MEDDKKKRKNKRKKNKQQKKAAAEDTSSNAGDTSSHEQNHIDEQRDHVMRSNGEEDSGSNTIIDDKAVHNNYDGSVSVDSGKQNWLQEEARLREMVKQLLYEKDSYIQRQADLESRNEQLQCKNDSWHQKEAIMEQRISQLLQDKAAVSLEEGNLRQKVQHIEKEKSLLVEKESSSEELIATLNKENARLRMQVLELEGATNSLSQENRQLLDSNLTLESRIQDLERSLVFAPSPADAKMDASEKEDLNAQIEAACALVEKLVTENAELVEKVNELYMELGRRSSVPGDTSVVIHDSAADSAPVSASGEDISLSSKSGKHSEVVPIGDEQVMGDTLDSDYGNVGRQSSDTTVSGEIVQIPLDENEAQDLEAQASTIKEDESVPMTDAPLIGAPFRLISFVAKYVSGADLVNKQEH